jgi:hypothetical protein
MISRSNYVAQHGARLIENGYPVLPIMPGTKKPGRFSCGTWRDYPAWERHCHRATTAIELGIWSEWPDAGIGIACGYVVGVDIDELDADKAWDLDQRARRTLGNTPLMRIGLWPKRTLVYRADEPFSSISEPIEILALGRQFVAFADHPDTGRPYQWSDASPVDVPLAELPEVDLDSVHAFLGERPRSAPATGGCCGSRGTPEAIADALRFVPNADLAYGEWVRIGMAIRGALGDDGWPLFADWSATSDKDVPATTADAWSRFRPNRIGAGTIYHRALTGGWQPPAGLTFVCNGDAHPAQALLAKIGVSA